MPLSAKTWMIGAFIVAAILFAASFAAMAAIIHRLDSAEEKLERSYRAITVLGALIADVEESHNNLSNYIDTGRRSYLQEDMIYRQRIAADEMQLRQLLRDRLEHQQRLRTLEATLRDRNEMSGRIMQIHELDRERTRELLEQAELLQVSKVRNTLNPMLRVEYERMDKDSKVFDQAQETATPALGLLFLSGLAMLGLGFGFYRRTVQSEKEYAGETARFSQEIETNKQLFASFMSFTPAIAWIKSNDSRLLFGNKRFFEALNMPPSEVIGKTERDYVPHLADEAFKTDKQVLESGEPLQRIHTTTTQAGPVKHWLVVKFPIKGPDPMIGGLAYDITQQKNAEDKIVELNNQLEARLKQLELARNKALEASALKSAFVANISHEIRTPLSGVVGMNELLLTTELDQQQREFAMAVQESSKSLLSVLNDILDISKIEAGKMIIENVPFSPRCVIEDVAKLMSAAARTKKLNLITSIDERTPEWVLGDPERFKQVLLNLIGNAVKFTEAGEVKIETSVLTDGEESSTVCCSIADTGIGIAPDDLKDLFIPFAQVDSSSTRRFGGAGLGLAICKDLVQRMGGHMDVVSHPGHGSTFWFVLPFKKSAQDVPEAAESTQPTKIRSTRHKRVLVVEDNPLLRNLAIRQFTWLGLEAVAVESGVEAVEAVRDDSFSLVFMDVYLPKMSGYEATRLIREWDQRTGRHTPIVAMTAVAMEGDREKCLAAGMDDYLSKPVSMETLRRTVDRWLPQSDQSAKSA